jgi:hypothetical protein
MPPPDLHRYRPGEKPAAADLDANTAAVLRQGRWSADRGLTLQDGPAGRQLARTGPDRLPLLLAGTTSPYTGVPAQRVGGAWEAIPGAPTFPVVLELNDTPGLGGEVHEAFPVGVSAGGDVEWAFQAVRFGAPCEGSLLGTVYGCGGTLHPLAGVVLALGQGGTTLATTTSDGSGHFSFAAQPAGSYQITPSRDRYSAAALTVTLGCATTVRTILLRPAAGYVCCQGTCDPLPTTLHLTDTHGTIALAPVYTGSGAAGQAVYGFWGCYLTTRTGYTLDAYGHCVPAAVTGAVGYLLYCPGTHRFCALAGHTGPNCHYVLEQQWMTCLQSPPLSLPEATLFTAAECGPLPAASAYDPSQNLPLSFLTSSTGRLATSFVATADRCPALPFAQSFTLPADALVPGTVTVSE